MPPSGRTIVERRCIRRAKSNLFFLSLLRVTWFQVQFLLLVWLNRLLIVYFRFAAACVEEERLNSQHTVNVNECCITCGGRPQGEPTLERLRDGNIHMCFFSRSGYRPFITPPPSMGILLLDITLCSIISFRCHFVLCVLILGLGLGFRV